MNVSDREHGKEMKGTDEVVAYLRRLSHSRLRTGKRVFWMDTVSNECPLLEGW